MSTKIRKRKSFDCLSHDQKKRNKDLIKFHLIELHKVLLSMSLTFGKVLEFFPINQENITINRESLTEDFSFEIKEFSNKNTFDLFKIFRFKEEQNISDQLYINMKNKLFPNIPSIYQIKELRKSINSKFEYHYNSVGIFLNVRQKLTYITTQIVEKLNIKSDEVLNIKFCGDGTLIGRNLKILNFGFSCLNEKKYCKTSRGHYSLGIFEIMNENYDELKICLKEIFEQISEISFIEHKGDQLRVNKVLGGDLKFLANVMGIDGANSNYPCILCTVHKKNFFNNNLNTQTIKRTIEESKNSFKKRDIDLRKGYAREPIAFCFPFDKCTIDLLHLFLRITDVLEEKLIVKLKTIDAIEINPSECKDLNKQPMLKKYIDFLANEIGISRVYYHKDNSIVLRNLVGNEKLKLFEAIDIELLYPQDILEHSKQINMIWKKFYNIYMCIKFNMITSEIIKKETTDWLTLYSEIYDNSTITPYMHIFQSHLCDFVQDFGDINDYNLQGFEKQNDQLTKDYFGSTNRQKQDFLRQLIQKRNRIEIISFNHFFDQ